MASVWTITEVKPDGRGGYIRTADGEQFRWTSGDVPFGNRGGARAAPFKPVTFPLALRSQRTDYPGSTRVSEQVLGANYEPFTVNGKWSDKFNYRGYGLSEQGRFEEMLKRGRVVKIEWNQHSFIGLITRFVPDDSEPDEVRYTFTVSNHGREAPLPSALGKAAPHKQGGIKTRKPPGQAVDEAAINEAAMEEAMRSEMRAATLKTTLFGRVVDKVADVNATLEGIGDTVDQRVLKPITRPVQEFKKLATEFRVLQGNCAEVLLTLTDVRSDTELAINTAMDVLDFEVWYRSMRFYSLLMVGQAGESAKEMDKRDEPDAIAIYEPYRGESLYSVSNRFFGTPFMARAIAARNSTDKFIFDGDEELIIPERGAG